MKNFTKKFAIFALLLISVQSFMFSKSEEKSLLDLNKEVLSLKYELVQMENKLGEYKDASDFILMFKKAKTERLLKKRQAELKERNEENKEEAKKAFDQAMKEMADKGKDLKKLGKDIGNAFADFFAN